MNQVEKVKELIKYCPHCGYKSDKDFTATLSNGGVWECFNCDIEVEAYVLSK